ncbi:hypothetical protein B0A55_07085 [Friedmanniomyces simplex]|uniref:Uncharacterized protein n=1 Tax=Friedmanniomyces simplex TaxID=329884 RepID=A0A4U0XDX7_9PEZI|nr:hypothetical protein B0A55_07085 [Friedmanniomyces simplex]
MAPLTQQEREVAEALVGMRNATGGQEARPTASPTAGEPTKPRYSEATGRSIEPSTGRRRSLFPVDRRNIGYLQATPANRPELFPRAQAAHIPAAPRDLGAGAADNSEVAESSGSEPDAEAAQQPAKWFVGQPQPQPLRYTVPTTGGGTEERTIQFVVDFNSIESVRDANKRRVQALTRRTRQLGIYVPARPSTKGREYSAEHDAFIITTVIVSPYSELTARFNAQFTGQNRTSSSISSHIARIAALKAARDQYDGAVDSE